MELFDYDIYDINEYDYELPEQLIAQSPTSNREESRLLALDIKNERMEDHHFYDIIDYLGEGDVLVRNNTLVIPARLFGIKTDTKAHVELLLLHPVDGDPDTYQVLAGNARVIKIGTTIAIGADEELLATCVGVEDEGLRLMKFTYEGIFFEVLERLGEMPLPPYIKKQLASNDRYQTVYATIAGSAAAPTAGFHFTPSLFKRLEDKGVEVVDITLHVGLGTFRPVKVDNLLDHKMHSEHIVMSQDAADSLNAAKREGRRIIAVGTTSTRTLETIYHKYGEFKKTEEDTSIFIYPGYKFEAISALITNFHLPKSTLLMLVSALASKDLILKAYNHAVKENYRFFSFGDAMFLYEGK